MFRTAYCVLMLCLCSSFLYSQSLAPFAPTLKPLIERIEKAELQCTADRSGAEEYARANSLPVSATLPNGSLFTLQKVENGIPLYYHRTSVVSAKTLRSNLVWSGGSAGLSLNGSGQTLGLWDESAVRSTHQEFMSGSTSRVTQGDNSTAISMHATHVSGTMIAAGVVSAAHGMANAAQLKAYDWNYDQTEMRSAAAQWMRTSNHSYGLITGWIYGLLGDARWAWIGDPTISATSDYKFGFYTSQSKQWDQIANDYPYYLICKAAGNDRGEGPAAGTQHWVYQNGSWVLSTATRDKDGGAYGYDCIEGIGLSKNVLTVGAVYADTSYTGPGSVLMSTFSSWGPADDGRIKPDVVSMGVSEYSSYGSANNAYAYMSGTSMATPGVTGSIGLLLQHQSNLKPNASPMLSSTMKGLLIHTADEAGSSPGPDYKFGWGLLNVARAAALMSQNAARSQNWDIQELTLQNGQSIELNGYSAGNAPVRVTIAWNDPAGTPTSPALNPTTAMLKNDLDLRIGYGTTTYKPYVLDPSNPSAAASTNDNTRDNVEQVYIAQPQQGSYTLHITHKGTLTGGAQIVSLLISGLEPPGMYVSAGSAMSICPGTTATLQGSVTGASTPSYAWTVDGQSSVLSTGTALTVSPGSATTYRFTVTDGSQTSYATVTVSVNTPPTANAGNDVTITSGQSTTLNANTSSNPGSTQYSWFLPGNSNMLSGSAACSVQPTATASYVLRVNASGFQCYAYDTVVVTVNAVSATANAGPDKTICAGSSVSATGSGTGSGTLQYKWIDLYTSQVVSQSQALNQTPSTSRSYVFKVTDQAVNIACDTMNVVVLGQNWSLGEVSASASPCMGCQVSYSVSAVSGVSYHWLCSAGTILSGANSPQCVVKWSSTASTGLLTITETLSSCTKSQRDTIALIALPTPNFSVTSTCVNETKSYTASDNYDVSYSWSLPSGGGTIVSGGSERTVSVTWNSTGTRNITLVEQKSSGCANSLTKNFSITSPPTPSITVNTSATPHIGQNRIYHTNTSGGYSNLWTVTGGNITSGQGTSSIHVHWTNVGGASVSVTQTKNSTGCTGSATLTITVAQSMSLEDEPVVSQTSVYPNPATNTITLSMQVADNSQNVVINVMSLNGQSFIKKQVDAAGGWVLTTLDVSSLASGVYVVHVQNGVDKQSIRFIKE